MNEYQTGRMRYWEDLAQTETWYQLQKLRPYKPPGQCQGCKGRKVEIRRYLKVSFHSLPYPQNYAMSEELLPQSQGSPPYPVPARKVADLHASLCKEWM